jgi:hypothetical protein
MSDNIFRRILHDLHEKQAREDSRLLPKATTRREPSKTEREAEYTPPGYYLLFCFHKKSLFEPCSACRRDKKEAREQYNRFCKRHGLNI